MGKTRSLVGERYEILLTVCSDQHLAICLAFSGIRWVGGARGWWCWAIQWDTYKAIMQSTVIYSTRRYGNVLENCRLDHRLLGDTGPAGAGYCTRPDEFEFTISNPTLI
jgi:hypothetical protein